MMTASSSTADDSALVLTAEFLGALERIATPVWVFDLDRLSLCWANAAALALWGATGLDELRRRDFSQMTPAARTRLDGYRQAFGRGERRQERWTFYPHGHPVTVMCHCSPIRPEDGRLSMLVEAHMICETASPPDEVRAMEALRHIPAMIMLFTEDGHLLMHNPAAQINFSNLTGMSGDSFAALFADPADAAEIRSALEHRQDFRGTMLINTIRGPCWHAVDARSTVDPITGKRCILINQIDVSERMALEGELRSSEEALAGVLALSPVAILVSRLNDGTIVFLNEKARDMFGIAACDMFDTTSDTDGATNAMDLYADPTDQGQLIGLLTRTGVVTDQALRMRSRTGRIFWVSCSALLLPYDGQPSIIACLTDIDKMKEAEATLQNAIERERQINQFHRQFISVTSHEFRTPLAVIDSIAQRVVRRLDRVDSTELTRRMRDIRSAVARMAALVDSTLEAARCEEGSIRFKPQLLDPGELVREVCRRQQDIAPQSQIRCILERPSPVIMGDPHLLERVFANLLSNAVKYSPNMAVIEVRGRSGDGCFVLDVTDRGLGIPEEDQGKLFQRFFRAGNTVGINGSGVGLSIVRQLVELHGGTITLTSKVGQGSTFTVRLPLAATRQQAAQVSGD